MPLKQKVFKDKKSKINLKVKEKKSRKKEVDVSKVFYSAEYEKKVKKINNTKVDATNILDPNFEEKKENLNKTVDDYLKNLKEQEDLRKKILAESNKSEYYSGDNFYDKLIPEAMKFIAESNNASISGLQRKFKIGFAKGAAVIDLLEENKLISGIDPDNLKPREIYFKLEEVEDILKENNNFKI